MIVSKMSERGTWNSKADMVGAWKKRNIADDIRLEKLEENVSGLRREIAAVKKISTNFAKIIDAKLDTMKDFLNAMVIRQEGTFSFLEEYFIEG